MMMETTLARSLRLMFSSGLAIGVGLAAQSAGAQTAAPDAPLQRVEITGSSIKRIVQEGALPVQTLTKEDIAKSGATSATELIQMLPAMQNFQAPAQSVNGAGGGITTAALHSLPAKYTLVLLDGQRVAPAALNNALGGGFAVNLESIPLDAVERVEILTDGASALYGSDAIAGVVNFILKKNKTDGDISFRYNQSQHPGGNSNNIGLSKGFGNLQDDGFNVLFSYAHDRQDALQATQRPVSARGAYFPFSANGTNYIFNARTGNTEPANVTFSAATKGAPLGADGKPVLQSYSLNPYYRANGNCGTPFAGILTDPTGSGSLGSIGESCRFNFAATVQDIPSTSRDSGLLKGTIKLNADTTLWGEVVLTSTNVRPQFAPGAQPLGANSTTRLPSLYNAYVQPFLDANNLYIPKDADPMHPSAATLGYRAVGNGGRTDDYKTDARHFATGIDGSAFGWDYNASLTLSHSQATDTAAGGYTDFFGLRAAVANGQYNPILGTGLASIAPFILNSEFSKTISDLNTLHVGAQHNVFDLPGGTSIVAIGADYSQTHYRTSYSDLILSQSGFSTQPASSDFPVGGNYGQIPFDASRNNYGAFAEWALPITKRLDVTVSGRYDSYGKTRSKYVFDTAVDPVSGLQNQIANADLGDKFNATTGKISFRFLPVDSFLLRGSYGTGFKAPNISDIAGGLVFGGSTTGTYPCPFPGSQGCMPGSAQYDLVAGPNGLSGAGGLKPEKSKQWTIGFRVDPLRGLSLGADWWDVKIRNQVISGGIAEADGFNNPQKYANLFLNPYQDPAGFTTIAFQQLPFNGGEAEYQGVDWDFVYKTKTPYGNLVATWNGTQMLKQKYNFGEGQAFNTDLGVFGPDQQVVFRTIMNIALNLQTGAFDSTLAAHYRSGYKDVSWPVGTNTFLANPDGSLGDSVAFGGLRVPSYSTFDFQTKYTLNKQMQLTFGIKNLLDKQPPLSLQNGGGGNALGFDGRYADPIGRQYYLVGNYHF